jgi:hypothetical protein
VEQGQRLCRVATAVRPTFMDLSLDPGACMRTPGEANSLSGGTQRGPDGGGRTLPERTVRRDKPAWR